MSRAHVEQVFGPQWVQDAREHDRIHIRQAERTVLSLRRKLRAADPALPNESDGTAWQPIEAEYLS